VDPARAKEWIDAIVACHVQNGTLDDTAWAAARARVLVDRGVAPSAIPARLFANGISSAEARQAIRGLEDADPELHAAVAYVRRRRLGPYRVPEEREARREKDLSTLCRAGFSFLVAEKILDVEDVDALLALE
jgi:regulatory protein